VQCQQSGHGFVFRVMQDRVVLDPATGGRLGLSLEVARAAPGLGHRTLELRSRPGQAARRACLAISRGVVRLQAPERPGVSSGVGPPIDCGFVRVWEVDPPAGVAEPLEWVLYTDATPRDAAAAWEVARMYEARWLIEEFHKCLKTGLNAEALQLETGGRLFAAIAVMSVVAVRLLDLRELGRREPEAAAARSGLSGRELDLLSRKLGRRLESVGAVLLAVGRLGGHLNRKGDGLPGWLTLWRGMICLRLMVEGADLLDQFPPPLHDGEPP